MSVPPIHARTVRTNGGSCFSGILHLGASQFTTMPASDRFFVAFALGNVAYDIFPPPLTARGASLDT